MFKQYLHERFKIDMWSDEKLAGKQSLFCLCTSCNKENENLKIECPIHKRFMEATRYLMVGAPIFACPDFAQDTGKLIVDIPYDPINGINGHYVFAKDWETQKKIWGLDDKLQPIRGKSGN
jgi:hypothetical protein